MEKKAEIYMLEIGNVYSEYVKWPPNAWLKTVLFSAATISVFIDLT